jgi:hypothetical protein
MFEMRSLRHLVFALAVLSAAASSAGAQGEAPSAFLSEVPDLPLMAGLVEIDDAGVVFDKPEGRIVERYARGEVAAASVLEFYRLTLPELGWRTENPSRFLREGERLEIDILGEEPLLTLRFRLSPQ